MAIQTPIRGLRSFCVAARSLSFKKTADQLFLTPSAVSHQIKQLEEQLGFKLFNRLTRSLTLTESGYQFYKSLSPIIDDLETTVKNFTQTEVNPSISLAVPEFFANELLIPQLSKWNIIHPDINLNLEILKDSRSHQLNTDLSIVLSGSKPTQNQSFELFPINYLPAGTQQMAKKFQTYGFDILASEQLILHQARPWAWHQWAEQQKLSNFAPKNILQLSSMNAVARATQQGLGIALIPMPVSRSWIETEQLTAIGDKYLNTNDKYYLVKNEPHNGFNSINVFVDWLKETAQTMAS